MNDVKQTSTVYWHEFSCFNRPDRGGDYLVITKGGWLTTLEYDADVHCFCWDSETGDFIEVAYWAIIPPTTDRLLDRARKEYINECRHDA